MKKIDIKGKNYIPVNERIIYFRQEYPEWSYLTDIIKDEDGIIRMCTTVYDDKGVARANGYAEEKEGSTFINKTSYIENCETSAVGRALGNMGIGVDTSVASFEEVANAITQQNTPKKEPTKKAQQEYSSSNERAKLNLFAKIKLEGNNDEAKIKKAVNATLHELDIASWKELDLTKISETVFLSLCINRLKE